MKTYPVCGAKNRAGTPCQKPPLAGKKRCRLHGGTCKPNTNSQTHGIYTKHLTETEQTEYRALDLGTLDHELRITRIRLSRALAAEKLADGKPELDEVIENEGGGVAIPRKTTSSKVKDYAAIIDRLTGRIESLEKTRMALKAENKDPETDDIEREDTYIAPDELIPDAPIL